jgi:hypothetical protein
LTTKILARLKNNKNPGDGTEPCPELERDVRITFAEDDYDRLRMAVRQLEQLGFADDDISRLHPDHPSHCSFLNKDVYVRMKVFNDNEYWNLAWPREKAKAGAIEEVKQGAANLQPKIAEAKRRMKEERKRNKDRSADPPSDTTTSPDVPY